MASRVSVSRSVSAGFCATLLFSSRGTASSSTFGLATPPPIIAGAESSAIAGTENAENARQSAARRPMADRIVALLSERPSLTPGTDGLAIEKMMARVWERKTRVGAQDMTATLDDPPGFAPDDDTQIPYMARTRE